MISSFLLFAESHALMIGILAITIAAVEIVYEKHLLIKSDQKIDRLAQKVVFLETELATHKTQSRNQ